MSAYAWPANTGSVNNTQQLSSFVDTEFMLWLTDDDYLLEGAIKKCLLKIPTFQEQNSHSIFSPLDTFNHDGSLLCTVSPGFSHSQMIPAWSSHCAGYAWAFSRQIWKTEHLRACQERINASSFLSNSGYWMIYPAVLAISASKAFFWNESLVCHVYGNVVHWEEFGSEGLKREARLSLDFNMTYLLGALDFLKVRISIIRVYSQLVQFTKVASNQNFYRGRRFPAINLKSCLRLVVHQQTCIRHFLATGFFFLIFIGYPFLLINRILKRVGFG